jgi:hypothetical protein
MRSRRKRGGLPERPHRLPQAMDKKGPTRIRQNYGTLYSGPGRKAIAAFDSTKDSNDRMIKRANQAEVNYKKKLQVKKYKKGGFPDLTGDGKVTKADILKGRKVFKDGGKMCGCGKTTCEGGCKMYKDGGKVEAKRALKKAVRRAKREKRRRELDRDPQQILLNETHRRIGTKGILKKLG